MRLTLRAAALLAGGLAACVPSPEAAPRAVAVAASKPVQRDLVAARAHADACGEKLGARWHIERRQDVGAFALVVAHPKGEQTPDRKGCVATNAGVIEADFGAVVSADRDVDGDGRPDIVLSRKVQIVDEDDAFRLQPVVVADRAEGPVLLALDGYDEAATWSAITWAAGEPATIELRLAAESGNDRQRLAWNGKALASRDDTWLRLSCYYLPHTNGSRCTLLGAGRGQHFSEELGGPVIMEQTPETRVDFVGDGSRVEIIRWVTAQSAHEPDFEPEHQRITVHLGAKGWEVTNLPIYDLDTVKDRDGDGRPEVEVSGESVRMNDCPPKGKCVPELAWPVGLVTWDGSSFSSTAPSLAAAYAKAVLEVKDGACPTVLVGAAGLAYLKARWAGGDEAAGLTRAGDVIGRGDPARCDTVEGRLRPFAAYRADLAAALEEFIPEATRRPKKRAAPTKRRKR